MKGGWSVGRSGLVDPHVEYRHMSMYESGNACSRIAYRQAAQLQKSALSTHSGRILPSGYILPLECYSSTATVIQR